MESVPLSRIVTIVENTLMSCDSVGLIKVTVLVLCLVKIGVFLGSTTGLYLCR